MEILHTSQSRDRSKDIILLDFISIVSHIEAFLAICDLQKRALNLVGEYPKTKSTLLKNETLFQEKNYT